MACDNPDVSCSREEFFRQRLQAVLGVLACQYPSLLVQVDLWRPKVVSDSDEYSDETTESWIRLGENVEAFILDQPERFFQADVGIINQTNRYLLLPEGYGLRPDDHIIVQGQAWLVVESTEQMGVAKVKLDKTKQRFKRPGRFDPTLRELGVKAAIL